MFPLFISSYMVLLGGQIQTHPTPPWHTMDLALTANTVVIDLTAEQGHLVTPGGFVQHLMQTGNRANQIAGGIAVLPQRLGAGPFWRNR